MIRNSMMACMILVGLSACDASNQHQAKSSYPDANTPEFKQFSQQCSLCHKPPMPSAHTALEWRHVVERMNLHKAQQGMEVMGKVEKTQVLTYLVMHSKQDK